MGIDEQPENGFAGGDYFDNVWNFTESKRFFKGLLVNQESDSLVVVGAAGDIFVVDRYTGEIRCQSLGSDLVNFIVPFIESVFANGSDSEFAAQGNVLAIASLSSEIVNVYDMRDCKLIDTIKTTGDILSNTITINDGKIFIVQNFGSLIAYDTVAKKIIWEFIRPGMSGRIKYKIAKLENTLILWSGRKVYGIDPQKGDELWQIDFSGSSYGPARLNQIGNFLLFDQTDSSPGTYKNIAVVDGTTGDVLYEILEGIQIIATTEIKNEYLVLAMSRIASQNLPSKYILVQLREKDYQILWQTENFSHKAIFYQDKIIVAADSISLKSAKVEFNIINVETGEIDGHFILDIDNEKYQIYSDNVNIYFLQKNSLRAFRIIN